MANYDYVTTKMINKTIAQAFSNLDTPIYLESSRGHSVKVTAHEWGCLDGSKRWGLNIDHDNGFACVYEGEGGGDTRGAMAYKILVALGCYLKTDDGYLRMFSDMIYCNNPTAPICFGHLIDIKNNKIIL